MHIPDWYNHEASQAVTAQGTQVGATCGLFAVNHILAGAALAGLVPCQVRPREHFEMVAKMRDLGDTEANLIEPGGSNYDWSVLHANLDDAGLAGHPMTPFALQGDSSATSRLENLFEPLIDQGLLHDAVG